MSLSHWARLLGWLATESAILVAGAAVLQICLRSPRHRRTIWRAALITVALVWMVELSGLRERIPSSSAPLHRFVVEEVGIAPIGPTGPYLPNNPPAPMGAPAETAPTAVLWPAWLWLAGSVLLLARICLARLWLALPRREAAFADADSLELIARWQASFGLSRVRSQSWPSLRGPVAFGTLRPTIALPPDFARQYSSDERAAMLAHEMAHLAARDPFWWTVSDAVIVLAWWQPLIWWGRRRLQAASEAAADEASVLMPGGAHALAECLVRLGRELTASNPARALGIGGNGPRSQLAARIRLLLRGPCAWRPLSVWARWLPQIAAIFTALATALLPIQSGLSGSILAVLATAAPVRAESSASQPQLVALYTLAPVAAAPTPVIEPVLDSPPVITPQPRAIQSSESIPQMKMTSEPALVELRSVVPYGSNAPFTKLVFASGDGTTNEITNQIPFLVELAEDVASVSTNPVYEARSEPVPPHAPLQDNKTNASETVLLAVKVVAITERGSGDLGLDWLFGKAPSDNPVVEVSHDATILGASPATNLSSAPGASPKGQPEMPGAHSEGGPYRGYGAFYVEHPEDLVIDVLRTEGQSAVLEPAQFKALLNQIEPKEQADVLGAPRVVTASGLQARIAVQNVASYVTGAQVADPTLRSSSPQGYTTFVTSPHAMQFPLTEPQIHVATNSPTSAQTAKEPPENWHAAKGAVVTGVEDVVAAKPGQPAYILYSTDIIPTGFVFDVTPTYQADGEWSLRMIARQTSFKGYDNAGNMTVPSKTPGVKPVTGVIPRPHFRVLESTAQCALSLGQTLALRGPLWTEETKTKGHFLVPAKTKSTRQRLYIFVTASKPTPVDSQK